MKASGEKKVGKKKISKKKNKLDLTHRSSFSTEKRSLIEEGIGALADLKEGGSQRGRPLRKGTRYSRHHPWQKMRA